MPSNLHIFNGNHLEVLVNTLAEQVNAGFPGDARYALVPETIVVQSKGMQRWISMAIARQNGICANTFFPFPNTFLEMIYARVFGEDHGSNAYDANAMTFRIMTMLPELTDQEAFASIRNYLGDDPAPIKLFQLSKKIADVFDQYLVFRPDMITKWEEGTWTKRSDVALWQSVLWNKLRSETSELHRGDLHRRLVGRLRHLDVPISGLPPRVCVFGISYLPVFHLQVLDALAYRIPVYLFLLNPCRQYWADIVSDRQWIRTRDKYKSVAEQPESLYMERGNRLLASWGYQGRQFFGLTQQLEAHVADLFADNSVKTLLGRIQQDILDLIDRTQTDQPVDPYEADGSLCINACHSPMREVEVLHDQLLGILDAHTDINPSDILVMTPDIGRYAPYIHAVFGKSGQREEAILAYSVADQSTAEESRLADAFSHVLELVDGRFEASRVMALLEYSSVRRRFNIDAADCPLIEGWIREANIRWGWDGADRQRQGLPRYAENTWRAGLDRLLLGFAISSDQNEMFAGIAPHQGIEGGDAQIMGAFVHYAETLHRHLDQMPQQAGLGQWFNILMGLVEALFDAEETSPREFHMLTEVIEQLDQIAGHIDPGQDQSEPVSFDVVRQFLKESLSRSTYGTGFLSGGVTFCAMLPMRSIPAKVICLLGMQHDTFPQDVREPGFNVIADDPRPGDRSKRDDDKYLFLEALISARRVFYISYIGRDIQDNSPKPPSVLVDELMEYVRDELHVDSRQLVTEHPLQPFSPSYFDQRRPGLFSYSEEDRQASRNLSSPKESGPFFSDPIEPPSESWRSCELDQICRFFAHPIRYLLEQRLGIYFKDASKPLEDIECFNLDPLDYYHASQKLLAAGKGGKSLQESYRSLKAAGSLPHGKAGLAAFDDVCKDVESFLSNLDGWVPSQTPQTLPLDLELPP
ncbi:MAG: exodeoxyribonuclease V subunit gamma, partial [Desulfobacteraceae bacterium]